MLFRKQLSQPLVQQTKEQFVGKNGGGNVLFRNILFRIVIPTILFAAIEYIPACLIRGDNMDLTYAIYKTFGGGTYWFTSALATSELILLLLLLTRISNIWFYFAICVIMGGLGMYFQHGLYNIEIWAAHRGIVALLILGCGGLYWKFETLSKYMKWYTIIIVMALYVSVLLYCNRTSPFINILTLRPLGVVTTLLSCVLLIELCKRLPENRIINYIGQNTLGFYFMSGALPIMLSMFAHKVVVGQHLWILLVVWVLCLVIAYFAVKFINRWLPWMFDIRKLSRKFYI